MKLINIQTVRSHSDIFSVIETEDGHTTINTHIEDDTPVIVPMKAYRKTIPNCRRPVFTIVTQGEDGNAFSVLVDCDGLNDNGQELLTRCRGNGPRMPDLPCTVLKGHAVIHHSHLAKLLKAA